MKISTKHRQLRGRVKKRIPENTKPPDPDWRAMRVTGMRANISVNTYTYKSRNYRTRNMAMRRWIYQCKCDLGWGKVRLVCQIERMANSAIKYKQVRGCDVRALSFDTHPVWVHAHRSSVQVLRATSLRVGFTSCNRCL